MLDVLALQRQIQRMVQEQAETRNDRAARLDRAVAELTRQGENWRGFAARVAESRTSWLLAGVRERVNERMPGPPRPMPHTVVATDGSQIFPDRHEVAACYLINVGRVVLPYGSPARPLLDSQPSLFYRERDLYHRWGGRRVPITDEVVGLRRQLMEFEALAQLAQEHADGEHPGVALSDGTLILWSLEGAPPDFRQEMLHDFLDHLDRFRALRVPVAGYISQPASSDVVNALRVGVCPEVRVDCDKCPWKGSRGAGEQGSKGAGESGGAGERESGNRGRRHRDRGRRITDHGSRITDHGSRITDHGSPLVTRHSSLVTRHSSQQLDFFQYDEQVLPCAVVEGVTDAMLFGQVLAPGERSAVFRSASQVLGEYGAHAVHFFYVHVGSEIARVEAPEWVVESPDLLERVHAVVVDQAEKGGGYPLALIEAHEKAVVRSAEREAFFRLLEEMLVRKGLPGAISSKGWSKRTPRI